VNWVSLSCTVIQTVIFIQNVFEPLKVRTDDYLGDLTDELEEFGAYPSFRFLFSAPRLENVRPNVR